jgi:hypothetical protein
LPRDIRPSIWDVILFLLEVNLLAELVLDYFKEEYLSVVYYITDYSFLIEKNQIKYKIEVMEFYVILLQKKFKLDDTYILHSVFTNPSQHGFDIYRLLLYRLYRIMRNIFISVRNYPPLIRHVPHILQTPGLVDSVITKDIYCLGHISPKFQTREFLQHIFSVRDARCFVNVSVEFVLKHKDLIFDMFVFEDISVNVDENVFELLKDIYQKVLGNVICEHLPSDISNIIINYRLNTSFYEM